MILSAGLEGWERSQKERWVTFNRGVAQEGKWQHPKLHSMTTSTSWFDHSDIWFQVPFF